MYGVLVHSCFVEDGQGEKAMIVDERGSVFCCYYFIVIILLLLFCCYLRRSKCVTLGESDS